MLVSDYSPQFLMSLVGKDFGYVIKAAVAAAAAPTIAAAGQVFQTTRATGLGDLKMTAIAKLFPASTILHQ